MFKRQKVLIFGFCFHLISKTIEISIVDSYEFESKKTNKKWHCSILHHLFRLQRYSITCRCQLRRLALIGFVAVSIYTVRYRHTYSRVQTYIQYGTDIWHRHKVCTDKRCIHMCADYRTDIPYWNMIHICMYSTLYIWCRQTDQPFSTDIPYTVHTYVLNQKKKWKGSKGHMTHMAWLTFSLGQKGHNR